MKLTSVATFMLILTLVFALAPQTVSAREPVDPTTLNPPPPPNFNPVCESVGNGTICDLHFSDPPFAAGSEVICGSGADSFEPFQFQNRTVTSKRYYDANGNFVRVHYREVIDGTFTNPINHKSVAYSGSDTHLHVLTVPGDPTSGNEAITGSVRIFLGNGNGTLALDTGRLVMADSNGEILAESGQHPFLDYFVFGDTAAVQPLCDALQ
jgi:hypothetical protein